MRKDPAPHFLANSWLDCEKNLKRIATLTKIGGVVWPTSWVSTRLRSRSGSKTSGPSWKKHLESKVIWPKCWLLKAFTITPLFLWTKMNIQEPFKSIGNCATFAPSSALIWQKCAHANHKSQEAPTEDFVCCDISRRIYFFLVIFWGVPQIFWGVFLLTLCKIWSCYPYKRTSPHN